MITRKIGGRAASVPALPTTSLLAQFDASDTPNHTPASGLWTPTAGSYGSDWQAKDGSDVNTTFGYSATPQNGLPVIEVPGAVRFRAASADTTATTDWMLIMAIRLNSGGSGSEFFRLSTSGSSIRLDLQNNNTLQFVSSADVVNLTSTNVGAKNAAFRIIGICVDTGVYTVVTSGKAGDSQDFDTIPVSPQFRSSSTTFFASPGGSLNIDVCETLIYSTASVGTLANAINYLGHKWNPA